MSWKAIAILCSLFVLSVVGWISAQQTDTFSDNETLVNAPHESAKRFELTLIGKDSAILLDVFTGESWYLRDAKVGTVWLAIPRIGSKTELEEWRQAEESNEGAAQQPSRLGLGTGD
jgi:hypothetical protein